MKMYCGVNSIRIHLAIIPTTEMKDCLLYLLVFLADVYHADGYHLKGQAHGPARPLIACTSLTHQATMG